MQSPFGIGGEIMVKLNDLKSLTNSKLHKLLARLDKESMQMNIVRLIEASEGRVQVKRYPIRVTPIRDNWDYNPNYTYVKQPSNRGI